MIAFDLDNTLANINFDNVYGINDLVARMQKATVRYKPTNNFIIITARGDNPKVQEATRTWVKENLPGCEGIYFVTGSGNAVVSKKIAVMKRHNVTEFADGRSSVLDEFKKQDPSLKLWHVTSHGLVKH
jgi:5'(3')-deoxyribonucleotidase